MADYEIFLAAPGGARLKVLTEFLWLECSLTTNGVSVARLGLDGVQYDIDEFGKNYRVEIERDGQLQGRAPFFIRKKKLSLSRAGEWLIELMGLHANVLLLNDRRVAYYAGSSPAAATNVACDDLIKRLARENLGSLAQNGPHVLGAADNLRDAAAPDLSTYFSVAADESLAPATSRAFSRQRVGDVLAKIAQDSYEQGTPLFYGIEKDDDGGLELRTRVAQWGEERTGLIVSPEFLNLVDATKEWDWTDELTVVYAVGTAEGENREMEQAENTAETGASPFNWVEGVYDARSSNTDNLQAEANSYLREHRARLFLGGELQETESFLYETDWAWGDRVMLEFAGERAAAWLNKVTLTVRNGRETIRAVPEQVQ